MLDDLPRPTVRCQEVHPSSCGAAKRSIEPCRLARTKSSRRLMIRVWLVSLLARLYDWAFGADRPPLGVSRRRSGFVPRTVEIGWSA